MDAFQEFYHAPILHANQSPTAYSRAAAEAGFEAPHYRLDGPHRLVSTSGVRAWEMPDEMRKPMDDICQSGLFGPWAKPESGRDAGGLNPAKCDPWGLIRSSCSQLRRAVLGQGWYLTYTIGRRRTTANIFEGFSPTGISPRSGFAQGPNSPL